MQKSLAGDTLADVVQAEADMAAVHEGSGVGGGVGQAGVAVAVEAVEAAVDEGGVGLSLALAEVVEAVGVGGDDGVGSGAGDGHVGGVDAGGGLAVDDGGGVGGVGVGEGSGVGVAETAVEEGGVGLGLALGNVDDTSGVGDVLSLGGVSGGADGVVGVDLAEGAGVLNAVGGVGGVGVGEGGGVAEAGVAETGVAVSGVAEAVVAETAVEEGGVGLSGGGGQDGGKNNLKSNGLWCLFVRTLWHSTRTPPMFSVLTKAFMIVCVEKLLLDQLMPPPAPPSPFIPNRRCSIPSGPGFGGLGARRSLSTSRRRRRDRSVYSKYLG